MRAIHWLIGVPTIAIAVVTGLAVLLAGAIALVFATAETDTAGRAQIPGLSAEVSVIRDTHGVPHIFAANRLDGWRALGYAHAQDRFFQMELARRIAAGRLAEVIGPPGLRSDMFMRTLGIHRLAAESARRLHPDTRTAVEAYVTGVNAWLANPANARPAELIVLGIEPEPWTVADSAAWGRLMALLLSGDWRTEVLRARLAARLSPEQLGDLWPDEPAASPTTLAALAGLGDAFAAIEAAIPDLFPAASASNEWAVSGSRSRSGKPLLANDPHLGLLAPGMWHLARIVSPEATVSGAALPGQPFFMVGQNGHIAWGLTTTHADTQDLYVERVHPDDPNQYLVPGGSLPFALREETIHVRWRGAPVRLTVRATRHGPVMSDMSGDAAALAGPDTVIALSFAGLEADDRTSDAFHAMNTAQTVERFHEALRDFHAPMQNVIYAHRDGEFGFVSAGRLPVRPGGPGIHPLPGWTGAHDWQGFVASDDLPRSRNPANGQIVNANNRVVGPAYPHPISNDWPEGFRARRILDRLADALLHDTDSFAAIQTDIVSLGARELRDAMLAALPPEARSGSNARMLADWDGAMERARPEPLLFAAWAEALQDAVIGDELGEDAHRIRGVRVRMLARMLRARQDWCDDTGTARTETCAAVAARTLAATEAVLRDSWGDTSRWRWGPAHRTAFRHPLFRFVPVLGDMLAPTIESPGGDHTVNRGTYRAVAGTRFDHVHGAGLRAIFDMADPDAARYIIAPGQSGHLNARHFADLTQAWRDGRYIVLKTDRQTLLRAGRTETTLVP
jgi:penicillin amidase